MPFLLLRWWVVLREGNGRQVRANAVQRVILLLLIDTSILTTMIFLFKFPEFFLCDLIFSFNSNLNDYSWYAWRYRSVILPAIMQQNQYPNLLYDIFWGKFLIRIISICLEFLENPLLEDRPD